MRSGTSAHSLSQQPQPQRPSSARRGLSKALLLLSLLWATSVGANQSTNPHSDYELCHAGSPPGWCANTCGNPDIWCGFAGFACTWEEAYDDTEMEWIDHPYFNPDTFAHLVSDDTYTWDMKSGDPPYELRFEWDVEDEPTTSGDYLSVSDGTRAVDWAVILAYEACRASGAGNSECNDYTTFEAHPALGNNPPVCWWEDWHCEVAQSQTICLQLGT